jgi:hypothetical protein
MRCAAVCGYAEMNSCQLVDTARLAAEAVSPAAAISVAASAASLTRRTCSTSCDELIDAVPPAARNANTLRSQFKPGLLGKLCVEPPCSASAGFGRRYKSVYRAIYRQFFSG